MSSKTGEGSCFTVNLSFAKAKPAAPAPKPKLDIMSQNRFGGKVLVVDDDAFILQLCGAILQKHRIPNICTADALSVVARDWDESVKLVLLDIRMPHLNGLQLCQALRSRIGRNTPILALTAQALPEEWEAILAQGFDGILMKPFREQELLALVQQHLPPTLPGLTATDLRPEAEPDLSRLLQMTGGNEALLDKIMHQFILDTRQDLDMLDQYLLEEQAEPVSEILHRLAGRTGQMGAEALAARLRQVEIALNRQEPLSELKSEVITLRAAVKDLKKKIESRLNSLQAV